MINVETFLYINNIYYYFYSESFSEKLFGIIILENFINSLIVFIKKEY